MDEIERRDGISRRRMIKKIGAGAAIVWSAPVLTSLRVPAFAVAASPACACTCAIGAPGSCAGGPGTCRCVLRVGTGGTGCFCAGTINTSAACTSDANCSGGQVCVVLSCPESTGLKRCAAPCGS